MEGFSLLLAGDLRLSRELILVRADTDRVLGSEEKMDLRATLGEDGREAGSESWRARDGRYIMRLTSGLTDNLSSLAPSALFHNFQHYAVQHLYLS